MIQLLIIGIFVLFLLIMLIQQSFSSREIRKYSCELNCPDRYKDRDCYYCRLIMIDQKKNHEEAIKYNAGKKWWQKNKAVYTEAVPGKYWD